MINIPPRFIQKLQKDQSGDIEGGIKSMKAFFNQIYTDNSLFFFNEYTDHGYRHINSVLEQIDRLIPPETWKSLSEKDVALIIISTFLHDLGMHLQPLTFKAMISGEYDDVKSPYFHDKSWGLLWHEYVDEARKFGDDQLKKIFGVSDYEIQIPTFDENEDFTENQKRLIGEFIRRHHPRMAYELAFKGLKKGDGSYIDLCLSINQEYKFLGGLIARSHGMDVRDTFEILQVRYPGGIWSRAGQAHVIYIMILLRLADYLQIDKSRVLKIPYETKIFKSPFSQIEHKKHLSIVTPQELPNDGETLFFEATPPDSVVYTSLKNLFKAIQEELDRSWAIISEVYNEKLKIRLKYRRIKSSLDEISLNDTLSFVSELITFSADKELLKLLIAPLYGYDPSYGIRELLQNAVDACWEREWLEKQATQEFRGQIVMQFYHEQDKKRIEFCIIDNGKGMTLNEIKNYFLRAGSSLRKSEDWRKSYMKQDKTPSICRIGKFGIGVLAAFLLGDEILVETRHISSNIGYVFKTKIDNENIEIQKRNDISFGTKITIYISDSVRDQLFRGIKRRLMVNKPENYFESPQNWDKWFCLDNPEVIIRVDNHPEFNPYPTPNPTRLSSDNIDWKILTHKDFPKVFWTYSQSYTKVLLSSNGIVIPEGYDFKEELGGHLKLKKPYVSCMDSKGNLPLQLNRNSLVDKKLPFEEALIDSILRDFLREFVTLNFKLDNDMLTLSSYKSSKFKYPGIRGESLILFSKKGYTLNFPFLTPNSLTFLMIEFVDSFLGSQEYLRKDYWSEKISSGLYINLTNDLIAIEFGKADIYEQGYRVSRSPSKVQRGNTFVTKNIYPYNTHQQIGINNYNINYHASNISAIEERFKVLFNKTIGEDVLIPYDLSKKKKILDKL